MSRYKADDIDLLLSSFAVKVRLVIAAMTARGFDPIPFDTLRTQKEADKFAARGVGSERSMHLYGVACDVICGVHGWDCKKRGCSFFEALGEVVESVGMVWGGRWRRHDLPHFQGCTIGQQDTVRSIKDPVARDAYIGARLCK